MPVCSTPARHLLFVEVYEFQNFDLIFLGSVIMCLSFLLILLLSLFGSMMIMLTRHSRRTFQDEVFIRNAKSFWQTSLTLTFPLSFTVGNGSHCVTSRSLVLSCLSRSFTPTCIGLIVQYLFSSLTFQVCAFLSHHNLLWMCFGSLG